MGRQSHLPLKRAFLISLNSLRWRFWRSIITAGGIFLGIAFLATVLTQSLMQWPVPAKIDTGYVKIEGQINGPGEFDVWKPILVKNGLDAGIPADVIERIAHGSDTFQLADIVQGRLDAARADKNLARTLNEREGLENVKKSFYGEANKDKDISIRDAVDAGVPEAVAKRLAGQGRAFKGSALADMVKALPDQIERWRRRAEHAAIFKTIDQAVIDKLDREHAITLNEAIARAKKTSKDADMKNIMVVNVGRKVSANFIKDGESAGGVRLKDGDNIFVPDRNTSYRMIWLVIMSLLVCTVGITNSMLMSVTERFKEIGTMKCLGALDKFVVTLFMLESGMLGIIASVLGWAVGFGAIVLMAGTTKGWDIVANIQMADVVRTFFLSVGAGMLLTICATIAPAMRAASMPAAMALRSEI